MKIRRENDYIAPSKGLAKWLHRTVMFITFPVRKPYVFIPLLIILYLAPTFMGVKPAEVHLWYWGYLKDTTSQVSTAVSDKTHDLMPKIELPKIEVNVPGEKTIGKVVDLPMKDTGRKMFEKAKSTPQTIDILEKNKIVNAPAINADVPAEAKKKLALIYVNEPKEIKGEAKIVNANEIIINNETIFLYGIYVDPNTQKGREAKIYLTKTIGTEVVTCNVEAYTYQGIATGICQIKNLNLNKDMVEQGFSKNVALQ